MNGRISLEETPEGRLAAVAKSLALQIEANFEKNGTGPAVPDYADYRDAFRPYLMQELLYQKEKLLEARVVAGRKKSSAALTEQMREMDKELGECRKELAEWQKKIPKEHRL